MTSEDESSTSLNSSYIMGLAATETQTNDEQEKLEKKTERCMSDASLYNTASASEPQKQKFKEKVEKLINKYKSAQVVRNIDKIMFMVGLSRLVLEAFIIGRAPCLYPYYFSFMLCFFVLCRFIYYRWLHWHYFLLDFCYWANFIMMLFLWVFPENEFLFISSYAFAMGPLLLAIPIFKNSMVIHSLDRITSVFIHLVPGYTIWGIRSGNCECWKVAETIPSFYSYMLYPSILYFIWAFVYYIILFKLAFQRCERKNNLTLFKYHLEDKKSIFYKLSGTFGEKVRPFAFMGIHMIFSLVTLILTYLTLYSHHVQFVLLSMCLAKTFWMAANYYMEIFTKNYELRLQQLENLKTTLGSKKND
jgi:hypothetical protein